MPLRTRVLPLVLAILAVVTLLTGCGADADDAAPGVGGDAATLESAPDAAVTGTTGGTTGGTTTEGTMVAPGPTLPADTYEIATAKGCELEVVARKGTGPSGAPVCTGVPATTPQIVDEPRASGSGRQTGLGDIPRVGLNSAGSRRTPLGWAFTNPTYFKNPLTFLVTGRDGDWLKVLIPARPNHTEGWVRASDVTITSTRYRMQLTLSDFRLVVYDGTNVIVDSKVVIGAPGTPTPTGRFYLNDKELQRNPYGSYGPWALSTNGYSEAMELFDGHLPVIAFHGTNLPGLVGTMSSNGCVRMPNDVDIQLANLLPLGTPIDILP